MRKLTWCIVITTCIGILTGCNSKHSGNNSKPTTPASIAISFSQQQSAHLLNDKAALNNAAINFEITNTTTGATKAIHESAPDTPQTVACEVGDVVIITNQTASFNDKTDTWSLIGDKTQTITVTQANKNVVFKYSKQPQTAANIAISFHKLQANKSLANSITASNNATINFEITNTTTGATKTIHESAPDTTQTIACEVGDVVTITNDSASFVDQTTTWTLVSGKTQTITVAQANTNVVFNYSNQKISGLVQGWPNYLAMGSITDASTGAPLSPNTNNGLYSFGGTGAGAASGAARPVNAIVKYEGTGLPNDIALDFPLYTVQTISQANQLTTAYQKNYSQIFTATNPVIPVIVIYTVNLSYGNPIADFNSANLKVHFIKLIMAAQRLEANKNANGDSVGSIILNPDFLGKVQQDGGLKDKINAELATSNVQEALKQAVAYIEQSCTYSYKALPAEGNKIDCQVKSYTGTADGLYADLYNNCAYGYYNAAQDWKALADPTKSTPTQCKPGVGTTPPSFSNDLAGWIQATNWIIKNFAPQISFGWQENIWSTNNSSWVHAAASSSDSPANIAKQTADFITGLKIYTGSYKPDFIALDRYEFDDFFDDKYKCNSAADPSCKPCTSNCIQGNQYQKENSYLYNARDWSRYLEFAGAVGKNISAPVMLWQIPGGHMQTVNDIDQRQKNGGTAPNFFFGVGVNDYSQLQSYISNLSIPTDANNKPTQASVIWWEPGKTIIDYLKIGPDSAGSGVYSWSASHLKQAAANKVFAILWGGGNTTGVADLTTEIKNRDGQKVYNGPGDDGGWLSQQIINYYKNPEYLVGSK